MFEFSIRATEKDPAGYYFPRWDQAEKLKVHAETKDEAIKKARGVLGKTGNRRGWPWAFIVDSINEINNHGIEVE